MEIPKPLHRLMSSKISEAVIRKGWPYLKMWENMLQATRGEIKKYLMSVECEGGTIELSETTVLTLEESERETISKSSIEKAMGNDAEKAIAELRRLGCFQKTKVVSMVERTKR